MTYVVAYCLQIYQITKHLCYCYMACQHLNGFWHDRSFFPRCGLLKSVHSYYITHYTGGFLPGSNFPRVRISWLRGGNFTGIDFCICIYTLLWSITISKDSEVMPYCILYEYKPLKSIRSGYRPIKRAGIEFEFFQI